MRRSRQLLALLFLAGFAVFSIALKIRLYGDEPRYTHLRAGMEAPEFSLAALDGREIGLAGSREENRLVVLNFWATWCAPCRLEMPQFKEAYADLAGDGLEILAISDEQPEVLRHYLEEKPVPFPVLVDAGGEVATSYGVKALPTTVIVDREGRVTMVTEGIQTSFPMLIRALLEQQTEDDPGPDPDRSAS